MPFLDTRVDFELIIENCVGDQARYRNFVEVTNDSIRKYDSNGNIITIAGTCL